MKDADIVRLIGGSSDIEMDNFFYQIFTVFLQNRTDSQIDDHETMMHYLNGLSHPRVRVVTDNTS